MPSRGSGKSWSRTRTGSPLGRQDRPRLPYCPTCSFFLVSTLITGSPAARNSFARSLMYRNWASRSGCRFPSRVRELPCRLNPSAASSRATVFLPHRCPRAVSSAAMSRTGSVVHNSGEHGSPRVDSSTSARSAGTNPGS